MYLAILTSAGAFSETIILTSAAAFSEIINIAEFKIGFLLFFRGAFYREAGLQRTIPSTAET
jgi:hypothetical protein